MKRFISNSPISRVAAMKQFIIVYTDNPNDKRHAEIAAVVSLYDLGTKQWNDWVKAFHKKYKKRLLLFRQGTSTISF